MEGYVRQEASRVLRLAPARIGVDTPLRSLGFDSLMSLELRNRLEAGLGIPLSSTVLWNYPTIEVLVPYLAERMAIPLDPPVVPEDPDSAVAGPAVSGPAGDLGDLPVDDDLGGLSVDDLEALLVQELNDLDS
ncbi:acyl carrier protein [Micromonospora echinospora]|uniref:acyl carrier protein n=1 Tax=Micromonospora echinospora TaxID=1877 RepID=UPI0037B4180E